MNFGYKNHLLFGFVSGFSYLFLVGILGVLMRSSNWITLPVPYTNILHAHSHTALLGWSFVMLISGILYHFPFEWRWHKITQIALTCTILGMFVAFLYQSYGAISISFSTIFVLIAYVYLVKIWKRIPGDNFAHGLLRRGILYFYISTLGIWVLGPTAGILGKSHALYNFGIQFFMHFQINGWLLFSVLGLIFKHIPNKFYPDKSYLKFLDLGLILGVFLMLLWIENLSIFYILNMLSVLCLFLGFIPILKALMKFINIEKPSYSYMIGLIIFAIVGKLISHFFILDRGFALSIEYNRELVIGFIHLILIGVISIGLIWNFLMIYKKFQGCLFIVGFLLFMKGFYFTELILSIQGFRLKTFFSTPEILLIFSIIMLLGMFMMLLSVLYNLVKNKSVLRFF